MFLSRYTFNVLYKQGFGNFRPAAVNGFNKYNNNDKQERENTTSNNTTFWFLDVGSVIGFMDQLAYVIILLVFYNIYLRNVVYSIFIYINLLIVKLLL